MKKLLLMMSISSIIIYITTIATMALDFPSSEEDEAVFPYERVVQQGEMEDASIDFREFVREDVIDAQGGSSFFTDFLQFLRLQGFTSTNRGDAFYSEDKAGVAYVINMFNLILQMAALIAVIYMIYGFYGMFFAEEEEGYTKARKIAINTSIAIAVMGLSFFVVNMLFYFYARVEGVEFAPNQSDFSYNIIQSNTSI